jgi:hypothetical protein
VGLPGIVPASESGLSGAVTAVRDNDYIVLDKPRSAPINATGGKQSKNQTLGTLSRDIDQKDPNAHQHGSTARCSFA